MATMLDGLDLSQSEAKKIVKKAIEHEAYSDEMPETKKGQIEAAHQAVAFCIDTWQNDNVRPDDEDEDIAAAGEALLEIFELAGVEVDDDGELSWGEPEGDDSDEDDDNEGDEDDESDDDDGEDDDAPFDPDDYIEGYSELTAASKIKKLNDLDLDDEDTLGVVEAIKEWEEEQDKPASRVLNWIEENLESDEGDDDSDDEEEDDDNEGDEENGEYEEPWKGYDGSSAKQINDALKEQVEDEDEPLTVEQVEYVKGYEEQQERPRKRILDLCDKLIEQLSEEGGDDDEEDEPEEKPAKKKGSLKRTKKSSDPDENDDADDAVARDDEKESRKKGSITLTREQVLKALSDGKVVIKL